VTYRSQNKCRDWKEIRYNPSFGQNTGLKEKIDQHVNRMPCYRLIENWPQKAKVTNGDHWRDCECVRSQQINKWPNSLVATHDDDDDELVMYITDLNSY
jgi:hypothetical protein